MFRQSRMTFKNREFIVDAFLKMPVVVASPYCYEEFISEETLWNTYP